MNRKTSSKQVEHMMSNTGTKVSATRQQLYCLCSSEMKPCLTGAELHLGSGGLVQGARQGTDDIAAAIKN